ncbi:class I SAM-dependent methyltransferase [Nocardia sp. NBC_01009]|uniref:class I SAM-dependent methyltransferase n=1 Tax=Nocardia sp. NBC_01009 TaxID=2975996 RepID=UPI00387070C0|nr:class I SAM-dependent methyltransferase [Nocardia sp. NBC_01009]
MTALGVAAARAIETKQPDALVHDEYAALFVVASGDSDMKQLITDPTLWAQTPFTSGFIGYRSRFFDDFFLPAAAAGVTQAVILAAGLDVRAYRLDWPVGEVVFEIDQPKVLEFKRQVLTESGTAPRSDRREVAVDLRDDWPAALVEAGFDPTSPTAWSAEGLLPYLPGAAQDALFARIGRLSAPGSTVAAETVGNNVDMGRIAEQESEYLKGLKGMPFAKVDLASLFYTDERSDPAELLTVHGWTTSSLHLQELAARYDRPMATVPEPLAQIFDSTQYLTASKPS